MATQLTVANIPYQGSLNLTANLTAVDTVLEYYFENTGYTLLVVKNDAMATNQVTVSSVSGDIPGTEDLVVDVAATSIRVFGPFQPLWWNQGGYVYVTFENDTTISVAAFNFTL